MEYINVKETALRWEISERRVRKLCQEGKISGIKREGKLWKIPINAARPFDWRTIKGKEISLPYKKLFVEIDNKNELLKSLKKKYPLTSAEEEKINENFTVEYTYNTNAIEGNTLTLQETALVLEGVTIDKKPLKEHLEIIGHKEAFDWIKELLKGKFETSEKLIKDIHSLVLMDKKQDAGIYRKVPVMISGASHTPPQPYLIESQMENLLTRYKKLRKAKHTIEAISLFHVMFEEIHPFIDGNGRTGRLLINYELMKNDYPPIDIKYKDVKKYYSAFECYHTKSKDISGMVELVADCLNNSIDKLIEIFNAKKHFE